MDHWNRKNSTFAVLDHHTYTADVHIPQNQKLNFKLEYSARDTYNLPNLSPASWANLVNHWTAGQDDEGFQEYYRNKYHHNINQSCGLTCKNETLCYLNMGLSNSNAKPLLCT